MKKRCQKGSYKSCFGVQTGDMGVPGSTYALIFDVLVRCQQKSWLFEVTPMGIKKAKKTIQITPGNIINVNEGVLMLAGVPGAATRATRKTRKERRKEAN